MKSEPSRRYRIAIVAPALPNGGGVPRAVETLVQSLQVDERFDPNIISLSMSPNEDVSIQIRRPSSWTRGVQVSVSRIWGVDVLHFGAIAAELEFMRYLPRDVLTKQLRDVDLIHVVAGTPCWANAVLGIGPPVLLSVASATDVERVSKLRMAKGMMGQWWRAMSAISTELDKRALLGVSHVLAMNPWLVERARRLRADDAVSLAPPGINTEFFCPTPKGEQPLTVLAVARWDDPRKNLPLLLSAFARLRSLMQMPVRLVLAGRSSLAAADIEWISSSGLGEFIDIFVGIDEIELRQLYRQATVFVLPSDEEGFGFVVAEAMACGTPVVATACGGTEVTVEDGKTGFVVPIGDAILLADRLRILLERPSLRTCFATAGRKVMEREFCLSAARDRILSVYDRFLPEQK